MTDRLVPKIPKVLSHYRVGRLLGQGGMGMVFEGTDRRDRSRVALKLLHHHLAQDRNFQDRFKREAHVAALLRSPYTVHLLDYGFSQEHYFLVMEFIEGKTLKDELEGGPLEPARGLGICVQVARALEEAQARGVVHRDIKPENIMLQPGDAVKVTDFGIARQLSGGTLTMTGGFLGTMAYAAPEQVMGRTDHRSDLYSLGATLYHTLAGRPPYLGGVMELIGQAEQAFPDVPLRERNIPNEVIEITRKALQKNPDARYNSASEMAGAMDRGQNVVGTAPMTDTVIAPPLVPAPATGTTKTEEGGATQIATVAGGLATEAPSSAGPDETLGDATEVAGRQEPAAQASARQEPAAEVDAFAASRRPAPAAPGSGRSDDREWSAHESKRGVSPLLIGGAAVAAVVAIGVGIFALSSGGGGGGGGSDGGDPPGNDQFADARSISALPFADDVDTSAATVDQDDGPAEDCTGEDMFGTVWYEYEAGQDQLVTVSTEGSDYDTAVAVFSGPTDDLDEIACDDDGGSSPSFTSLASFQAEESERYFLAVAGDGEGGQLELEVTAGAGEETPTTDESATPEETKTPEPTSTVDLEVPAPDNDQREDATVIVQVPFTDNVDTRGATTAGDDPSVVPLCGTTESAKSVWYRIDQQTDRVTIPTTVNTAGSDYDTVVVVHDATDGPLTPIVCSDDLANGNPTSLLNFTAEAGRLYFVEVLGFGPETPGGNLQVFIDVQNIDDIDAPAGVGFVPFEVSLDVTYATTAADDPFASCDGLQHSGTVWFRLLTPTFSDRLFIDTTGSDYDTVVGVWTGSRGALTEVACNDDIIAGSLGPSRLEWDAVMGTTYYISVAGYGTDAVLGVLQFLLDFAP